MSYSLNVRGWHFRGKLLLGYAVVCLFYRRPTVVEEVSMTDIEVVQQALEKSCENGWPALKSQYIRCYKAGVDLMVEFFMGPSVPSLLMNYEKVIFSHDWAEHFWGMDTVYFVVDVDKGAGMDASVIGWKTEKEMEEVQDKLPYYDTLPAYEYHLQQLVMEETQDRRIAYIERFL